MESPGSGRQRARIHWGTSRRTGEKPTDAQVYSAGRPNARNGRWPTPSEERRRDHPRRNPQDSDPGFRAPGDFDPLDQLEAIAESGGPDAAVFHCLYFAPKYATRRSARAIWTRRRRLLTWPPRRCRYRLLAQHVLLDVLAPIVHLLRPDPGDVDAQELLGHAASQLVPPGGVNRSGELDRKVVLKPFSSLRV